MFKMGPTEMKGKMWKEMCGPELVEILITHQQGFINSIRFTYRACGDVCHSKTFGEPNGLKFNMVEFDHPREYLTSVSGEYNKDGILVSIVFGTNKRKYGPFGRTGSGARSSSSYDEFNYEFNPRRFGGFHGSVYDGSVYAIGIYVKLYTDPYEDFCDQLELEGYASFL